MRPIIRDAIFLRYSLIHVIYNLFCEYACTGAPLMRPIWMEFPTDEAGFDVTDRFMFGPSIFVAPKMKRNLLYDLEDPDEVFGATKRRYYRDEFDNLHIQLPGGPDVVGRKNQVLWYDFQTATI